MDIRNELLIGQVGDRIQKFIVIVTFYFNPTIVDKGLEGFCSRQNVCVDANVPGLF